MTDLDKQQKITATKLIDEKNSEQEVTSNEKKSEFEAQSQEKKSESDIKSSTKKSEQEIKQNEKKVSQQSDQLFKSQNTSQLIQEKIDVQDTSKQNITITQDKSQMIEEKIDVNKERESQSKTLLSQKELQQTEIETHLDFIVDNQISEQQSIPEGQSEKVILKNQISNVSNVKKWEISQNLQTPQIKDSVQEPQNNKANENKLSSKNESYPSEYPKSFSKTEQSNQLKDKIQDKTGNYTEISNKISNQIISIQQLSSSKVNETDILKDEQHSLIQKEHLKNIKSQDYIEIESHIEFDALQSSQYEETKNLSKQEKTSEIIHKDHSEISIISQGASKLDLQIKSSEKDDNIDQQSVQNEINTNKASNNKISEQISQKNEQIDNSNKQSEKQNKKSISSNNSIEEDAIDKKFKDIEAQEEKQESKNEQQASKDSISDISMIKESVKTPENLSIIIQKYDQIKLNQDLINDQVIGNTKSKEETIEPLQKSKEDASSSISYKTVEKNTKIKKPKQKIIRQKRDVKSMNKVLQKQNNNNYVIQNLQISIIDAEFDSEGELTNTDDMYFKKRPTYLLGTFNEELVDYEHWDKEIAEEKEQNKKDKQSRILALDPNNTNLKEQIFSIIKEGSTDQNIESELMKLKELTQMLQAQIGAGTKLIEENEEDLPDKSEDSSKSSFQTLEQLRRKLRNGNGGSEIRALEKEQAKIITSGDSIRININPSSQRAKEFVSDNSQASKSNQTHKVKETVSREFKMKDHLNYQQLLGQEIPILENKQISIQTPPESPDKLKLEYEKQSIENNSLANENQYETLKIQKEEIDSIELKKPSLINDIKLEYFDASIQQQQSLKENDRMKFSSEEQNDSQFEQVNNRDEISENMQQINKDTSKSSALFLRASDQESMAKDQLKVLNQLSEQVSQYKQKQQDGGSSEGSLLQENQKVKDQEMVQNINDFNSQKNEQQSNDKISKFDQSNPKKSEQISEQDIDKQEHIEKTAQNWKAQQLIKEEGQPIHIRDIIAQQILKQVKQREATLIKEGKFKSEMPSLHISMKTHTVDSIQNDNSSNIEDQSDPNSSSQYTNNFEEKALVIGLQSAGQQFDRSMKKYQEVLKANQMKEQEKIDENNKQEIQKRMQMKIFNMMQQQK